ncbi:hypothetical protein FD688_01645 [Apilactobacillus kunkeei]|uniref:oligosaccharide flippase family protein n=1 Tax=Apilactobacillus kunkeei TaxID=148814 RepID=UPI00110CD1F8|nr:oligosaccharide flippase family protein [Apilactobacillus kunkeei]TMT01276.1 hypothetical protein FD688_01645 [Apilactobacillus kunkeei]
MNNNIFLKNAINMILSNMLTLLISFLSAFVTPVILGHDQYGYYKIFTLYITYVPLLHMGFVDGILIKYAGKNLEDISVEKFRSYTKFFFLFESILSLMMIMISLIIPVGLPYKKIFIAVSIYSLLLNMLTYFQFFSKCIMKFSELAATTRLQSYITFAYLAFAYVTYKFDIYKVNVIYYLVFMCLTVLIVLIWYVFTYKTIVFGNRKSIKDEKYEIMDLFKTGFAVMFSYQVIMFIINADNQFISTFFSVSDYSTYAFSYSLAFILVTVFGALTSIFLPYMKKAGEKNIIDKYDVNLSVICLLIFCIIISYYPIRFIVNNYLASYTESAKYLSIVFPGVGITCIIQSYFFNNYILLKKMKSFCTISLINLGFDYLIYYIFYLLFKNIFIIALLSIPLLLTWYLSLELYTKILIKVKIINNLIYVTLMSFLFIFINHLFNYYIGMYIYILLYIIITMLFYHKIVLKLLKSFINLIHIY